MPRRTPASAPALQPLPLSAPQSAPRQSSHSAGPRSFREPLVDTVDFAAAEALVRSGIDSARIVVAQGQDALRARDTAAAGCAAGDGPTPAAPHVPPWRTLVVIPTYNEKDNLAAIVRAIWLYLDCDILVVDDGSPDGTGQIADRLAAADGRLHVLHRAGKQGLGTAYLAGFRFAFERGYERVCEMDADFSHAPWDLPRLVFASGDAELVIGSRYVKGGCTVGWDWKRRMLSRGANLYTRCVLGSGIRDNTAGFRVFHVDALMRLDLGAVAAQGYAFQIEMAFRMVRAGCRVKELPIHFVDRFVGKSKMDGKIAREALLLVPKLRSRVPKRRAR
ncbi:MAG: polyprenol monophosphomannose synthase [Planctomycetes bacterium]|nr:polyprenol monophosphomannose synthase [Planctomycetota bacterium]